MKNLFTKKHASRAGFLTLALGILLMSATQPASADRYNRDYSGHPLQIISYPVHAVGIGLEYLVTRPIHYLVSRDNADILFGHYAQAKDDGTYFEWTHGDLKPSVAVERAALRDARQQLQRVQAPVAAPKPAPAPVAAPKPVTLKQETPAEAPKPAAAKPAEVKTEQPKPAAPAVSAPSTSAPASKPAPVVDITKK